LTTDGESTGFRKLWKNEYVQTVVVIGLIVLVVFGFWYGSQLVLNTPYPVLAVVTGSMCVPQDGACDGWSHTFDPTLHIGDLIIVHGVDPADLSDNYPNSDIIVFHKPGDPDELIVHRIVAKEERSGVYYFTTEGDGNGRTKWPSAPDQNDPWSPFSEDYVVGKVVARVPFVGHLVLFMRNSVGLYIVVGLVVLLIFFEFVVPLLRGKKGSAAAVPGNTGIWAYVKGSDHDNWHWCKNCTQYPEFAFASQWERPLSDLCPQCKTKEDNGECTRVS
jgi:signal peptidase I